MNRTTILRKPGHIVFDGVTFFSREPIVVEIQEDVVELPLLNFGTYDTRPTGRMVSVKFTPAMFNAAALAKLFPFGSLAMGASIVSATDKPLDIHTLDGERYRIPCGFLYKEPAASFGVSVPVLGEVEFRGIVGIDADAGALASYFAASATAYPGDTAWDPGDTPTPACTYSWSSGGASAWDDMALAGPLVITPEATLVEDRVEGKGLVNVAITDYRVRATAEPVNISSALVLAALGFGSALGSSKGALGRDLKVNAPGVYARLYNAVLKAPVAHNFDREQRAIGQLTWEAHMTFTAGARDPLLLVTETDPDAP